jgi:hypothetical protein
MLSFARCLVITIVPVAAVTAVAADRPLFPQPFVVEHAVTTTDPDGGIFTTDAVVDHYGGSWIVSVRPDGSRLIIDLARHELTEVRPGKGTWSVVTFERMGELRRRLALAEGGGEAAPPAAGATESRAPADALVVREVATPGSATSKVAGRSLRELRVEATNDSGASDATRWVEVWVDRDLRLTPAAVDALESFENAVAGDPTGDGRAPGAAAFVAAARRHDGGHLPVRTLRPARLGIDPARGGTIEDVALRIEKLEVFPTDLLEVPEGLERVPHPIELMVAWAEQEAELRERMGAAGN